MNQQAGSVNHQETVISAEDEISLTDLFRNLWRQRGLIIGMMFLLVAAVVALQFAKGTLASAERVDYPIALTFAKGKELTYPNGSVFSPNDLTASLVLNRVIRSQQLDTTALKLAEALSVAYSNSLLQQAEDKLSATLTGNKTPDDVKQAASDALKQLRAEGQRFITISLSLEESGLSAEQGTQLITALVDEWAAVSIEQGLLNIDIARPVTPFVVQPNNNLIDTYDAAASFIRSLSRAVDGVSEQPGAESLIVGGKSLSDIRREIEVLEGTDVGPLREFAYSNSSSLASVDPAIQVRLFARQRLLKLEQERLVKLIASYDAALEQLTSFKGAEQNNSVNNVQGTLQLDQSVIDSLLQMGTRLGAVENRNKVFERRSEAIEELLTLEKEMAILMGVTTNVYGDLNPTEILKSALPMIEQRLTAIQKDVNTFFDAYRDVSLQSGSQLYAAQAAPVVRGGLLVSVKSLVKYAVLAAVLGLMLGVMIALVRAAMLNSKNR